MFKGYDWQSYRILKGENCDADDIYMDTVQERGQEKLRIYVDGDLFNTFERFKPQAEIAISAHLFEQSVMTGLWTRKSNFMPLSSKPLYLYEWVNGYGYSRIWLNALLFKNEDAFNRALTEISEKRLQLDTEIKQHGYGYAYCRVADVPESTQYCSLENEWPEEEKAFRTLIQTMKVK